MHIHTERLERKRERVNVFLNLTVKIKSNSKIKQKESDTGQILAHCRYSESQDELDSLPESSLEFSKL